MASLRSYNNRRRLAQRKRRRFWIAKRLPPLSPTFERGYYYYLESYVPGVGLRYDWTLYRYTPRNPVAYYRDSVRYAGRVVMYHTKYYRRLFRKRNPMRWRAYS